MKRPGQQENHFYTQGPARDWGGDIEYIYSNLIGEQQPSVMGIQHTLGEMLS